MSDKQKWVLTIAGTGAALAVLAVGNTVLESLRTDEGASTNRVASLSTPSPQVTEEAASSQTSTEALAYEVGREAGYQSQRTPVHIFPFEGNTLIESRALEGCENLAVTAVFSGDIPRGYGNEYAQGCVQGIKDYHDRFR